jgi:hypothetical protein
LWRNKNLIVLADPKENKESRNTGIENAVYSCLPDFLIFVSSPADNLRSPCAFARLSRSE